MDYNATYKCRRSYYFVTSAVEYNVDQFALAAGKNDAVFCYLNNVGFL